MMTSRLASCIVVLLFICTETEGNATNVKERCEFKGNMCDLDDDCFKPLWDNYLIQPCTEHKDLPPRLLGVAQEMAFAPTNGDQRHYTTDNYTYSVYMSNDDMYEDVHLVPGCCNLDNKKNDTCLMPAISDPKVIFYAVFPFRKNLDSEAIYCQLKIHYVNLPIEFCVEGEEVVNPCLVMSEDGGVKMKYRYTPLSDGTISSGQDTNRCYFPLSAEDMPNDTNYPPKRCKQNKDGFIVMKPPQSAIVRNVTEHHCTIHQSVTDGPHHLKIATEIHNQGGDFACCGLKVVTDNSKYYPDTYCTNMQVHTQPSSILPIVLPVLAFVALLALIVCVQLCRKHDKFKKMADDWKTLPFPIKQHEDVKYEKQPAAVEAPNNEEFYEIVAEADDDTTDIGRATSISHISTSCEKQYDDRHQDEVTPLESTNSEGAYIPKCINSENADDSGFSHGSGSDLGQYCKKSYDGNNSEPFSPSPSSIQDSGYLAKTLTIGTANERDLNTVERTLKVDSSLNKVNSGSFNSGYTPKYIAKHNALLVDE